MVKPTTSSQSEKDIVAAHAHCARHRDEILRSDICGCFYCIATFSPTEIDVWIHERPANEDVAASDDTALCPRCGIDFVIGSASGYPITVEFLTRMKEHWF